LEAARSGRWVEACAWGLLALALGRLAVVVTGQLTFPLDLEFETLQLRTVRVIESGANPYGPETYASLPYVFSVYTPLYHLLVAALPEVAGRPFLVGRLLALGATLLVAAGFFLVDGRRTRPALAAFACGVFLLLWPVAGHAAYMRQEPLALLASAAAMLLLARGGARAAAGAAICCLLALGFKQSFLAAPVAGLLYVALARRRREALAFGGVLVGLGAAGAAAATLLWGSGFWFCTIAGTEDAWSGRQFLAAWRGVLLEPAFGALLVLAALVAASRLRGGPAGAGGLLPMLRRSPYAAFALVAVAALLASVGKVGSHSLYFLESILALLLWLVFELGRAPPSPRAAAVAGLLALGLAVADVARSTAHRSALAWPEPVRPGSDYATDARAALEQRGLSHPLVLNLGPLRAVGAIADDFCVNDALLYDRLFRTGRLSPEPLIADVRRQAFDVVLLTAKQPIPPPADAADPMSRVIAAVAETYRLAGRDLVLQYFVRDG